MRIDLVRQLVKLGRQFLIAGQQFAQRRERAHHETSPARGVLSTDAAIRALSSMNANGNALETSFAIATFVHQMHKTHLYHH